MRSRGQMLTTIAYQLEGKRTYALEGSIFIAGAAVQWLRDNMKLIQTAAESGTLAAQADPTDPVYMVPAFVGLGAPWWDADARAIISGSRASPASPRLRAPRSNPSATRPATCSSAMRADWPGAEETTQCCASTAA